MVVLHAMQNQVPQPQDHTVTHMTDLQLSQLQSDCINLVELHQEWEQLQHIPEQLQHLRAQVAEQQVQAGECRNLQVGTATH